MLRLTFLAQLTREMESLTKATEREMAKIGSYRIVVHPDNCLFCKSAPSHLLAPCSPPRNHEQGSDEGSGQDPESRAMRSIIW